MSEKLITVKEVALNNNCPECFSKEGLKLTFKQKFLETSFFKSVTQDIATQMHCDNCNTAIFPVQWTEDIERVYTYQMKAFEPKKASKKYKPLFWVIIGVIAAIAIATVVLVSTN
ncbi:hypothetical protein [Lacinutrix chionoecetis]